MCVYACLLFVSIFVSLYEYSSSLHVSLCLFVCMCVGLSVCVHLYVCAIESVPGECVYICLFYVSVCTYVYAVPVNQCIRLVSGSISVCVQGIVCVCVHVCLPVLCVLFLLYFCL